MLGVNAGPGPRNTAGDWLPDNARQLLTYTARMKYPLAAVEFGNEPNLFALSGVPLTYTAADYVRDLRSFDALRQTVVPHTLLIGPGSFYNNAGSETPYGSALGPLASQVIPAVPGIYGALAFHEYPATSTRCVHRPAGDWPWRLPLTAALSDEKRSGRASTSQAAPSRGRTRPPLGDPLPTPCSRNPVVAQGRLTAP